jgi:uncharacterized SAM-binding protein YcdF (DUF218 family)
MEVLIILAVLGVAGLTNTRRWRRWLIYPLMAVVVGLALTFSPLGVALANWGLTFALPLDSGNSVDAIVVLGRGEVLRERRVEIVNSLWKSKRSPDIFASGMLDALEIINRLKEEGVPAQALSGERCSQTTQENAQFTSTLLRPRKLQTILLVTDTPHMLRALLLFQSFGFNVIPYPASLPPTLDVSKQMRSILREYVAIGSYALTGQFNKKSTTELDSPPSDVTEKLKNWKCEL